MATLSSACPRIRRRLALPASTALVATTLALLVAPAASAHVTLHSFEAFRGRTDAELVLRVPNEIDTARTVRVQAFLPPTTPLIGVVVAPPAGWSATIVTTRLPKPVTTDDGTIASYVSQVDFRGGTIGAGQYQDFPIEVGLLPNVARIEIKALQTYSNGTVIHWIDSDPAAEHPAAFLDLAPSSTPSGTPTIASTSTSATPAGGGATSQPALRDRASASSVHVATGLAVAALVVAAGAGALAGIGFRRRAGRG